MTATVTLPAWAEAGERRRAHVARVVVLLETWGNAMGVDDVERAAWRDAARAHDALRDADEATLRALADDDSSPLALLHGPAAAARLAADGEDRDPVLAAVRWHTVGCAAWGRVGRALYLADYLEPGRTFGRAERAFLAAAVPHDLDGVFRQVVRLRIESGMRDGRRLHPQTVAMWNALV